MPGTNGRLFSATDVSADTGEVNIGFLSLDPNPAAGLSEQIVNLRMRLKTNVDDASGMHLCVVRWNDGEANQEWPVALPVTLGNYSEQGLQIWCDASRDVTVQISPLVSGGSVDVLILGEC